MNDTRTVRSKWIRLLVVSVVFGLVGLLVMWAKLYVTIRGFNFTTDAREVFVLLSAAVTGPVGGLVSGILSALADPPMVRWYSIIDHAISGLFAGWISARYVSTRTRNAARIVSWGALVFGYYYVFPLPVLLCFYYAAPEYFAEVIPGGAPFINSVTQLMSGWTMEFVLTLIVSSAALMSLPERYRTLYRTTKSDGSIEQQAAGANGSRLHHGAWPGGISIRLTVWFLLLSILPLVVVSVFLEDNVTQVFLLAEAGKQAEIAKELARGITRDGLGSALSEMGALRRREAQFFCVIDSATLKYVVHIDTAKIGTMATSDFSEPMLKTLFSRTTGITSDDAGGRAIGYAPIPGTSLRAVSVQGKVVILHALNNLGQTIKIKLGSTLLIISLVWGIVIWIMVGRPMKKMTMAAQEVARGNLRVTVDPGEMEAEIAVLAGTFNEMTQSLSRIHQDMESEISQRKATEDALREREKQFRLLAENSTDMISRHDLKGRYLYVSPASRFLLGYEPEEMVGRSANDFIHPDDILSVAEHHRHQLATETSNPIVFRILKKDGSVIWFESTTRVVKDPGTGEQTEIHISSRDVTQRMVTELALKESEERLRSVVSNVPIVLYSINENEVFTLSEGKGLQKLGLKPGQVVGSRLSEVYGEFPEIIKSNRRALTGEHLHDNITVGSLSFDVWYTPIRDEHERVSGVIGVAIDVTDRRRAEAAVRESERMHKTLVEQSTDPIYVVQNNRLVFVNHAWEKTFGYSSAEAVSEGFNLLSIVGEESRAIVAERLNRYASGGAAAPRYEMRGVDRDGSPLDLDVSIARIDWKGKPAIQGIYRDITERKRAEEAIRQSQKSESLGILAGGIAHDFNNLLQAILGQTSLALTRLPEGSPAYNNVAKAEGAAHRAAELTRQLLAYSGRGKFDIRPIDLNTLIHENLHFLELAIPKGVTLQEELATDLPLIEADAGQIQQVVMNLIINASEAIGQRSGRILLKTSVQRIDAGNVGQWTRATGSMAPGDFVQLEVTDNGEGMMPDTLRQIFDPFFTTKVAGRGLGLSAVIGIVKGHHGGLRVESEAGRRTTFQIVFPASEEQRKIVASGSVDSQKSRHEGCILVVDDEADLREVITDMLDDLGIRTLVAENGEQGVELYKAKCPEIDLVLLDLSMPGIGGKETFKRLKSINSDVKVIMTSGYSESEVSGDLKALGLTGFIQKPYRYETLRDTIVRHIGGGLSA